MSSTDLSHRVAGLSREERARLFERLQQKKEKSERIAPRNRELDPPPLSFSQQRLWFLDRLSPGDAAYNIAYPVLLRGPLRPTALEAALNAVVDRHEALRTTFGAVGAEPVQIIAPRLEISIPLVDLTCLKIADPIEENTVDARLSHLAFEEERLPFDLARGPLVRAVLLRLAPDTHALLLTLHHIVSDGWSMSILIREMHALYSRALGEGHDELEPLPLQYADFAVWQRQFLSGPLLEAQIAHWREHLAGTPGAIELPTDRPRPALKTTRGDYSEIALGEASAPLKDFSLRSGATPFITLLAVYFVLLERYSGQDDLTVGTPIANRHKSEIEGLIGFFVNTLVLRGRLAGQHQLPFSAFLEQVRRSALGAFAHQDLPFEKLVEELSPERDPSRSPLFQVMLVVHNTPLENNPDESLEVVSLPIRTQMTKFDLTATFQETEERGWEGTMAYNADLFDSATVERMSRHFVALLGHCLTDPSRALADLPWLTAKETEQLLAAGRGATRPFWIGSLPKLVAAQAERTPDEVAVRFEDGAGGRELTYRALARQVGHLAGHLARLGVGPESLVALALDRSPELILAILAVLEAGGAYLPLDSSYPAERLAFMLADSGASLLLTGREEGTDLAAGIRTVTFEELAAAPAVAPATARLPNRDLQAKGLAYVIYTSGSTGRPKGVMGTHAGLSLMAEATRRFEAGPGDRVLLFASPSFDASLLDVALALTTGATLVVAPRSALLPGLEMAASLAAWRITHLHLPPSALAAIPVGEYPDLAAVILGGEPCPPALATAWGVGGRKVWNDYGPTEAAVFVTTAEIGTGEIQLGDTVPGAELQLLSREGLPVPLGVMGEICLGGAGVARGYLGRPELTAERFIPHPFSGRGAAPASRLYRTGDLARRVVSGRLEYLGRADRQVKVRGFRVEPAEIEAVLAEYPGVLQAAVVVRAEEGLKTGLAGFVVPAEGRGMEGLAEEVRRFAGERLPTFQVPQPITVLSELPTLPNGKLDRRALESREKGGTPMEAKAHVPLRTETERRVGALWAEVLGLPEVGAEDNFFDLGGHSLLLTRVQLALKERAGVEVPLLALFEHTTVRGLAAYLDAGQEEAAAVPAGESRDRAAQMRDARELQRRRLVGGRD